MRRGIAVGITVGVALMILTAYGSATGSARMEVARNAIPDCGWILESGERDEARCATERIETVRMQEGGSRFAADALALCATTNGAALSLDDCLTYLAWMDATEHCRAMEFQADAEACLDRFPTK